MMQPCNKKKVFHKGSIFSSKVFFSQYKPAYFSFPKVFHKVFHKNLPFGKYCGLAFDFCDNFHNFVIKPVVVLNFRFNRLNIAVDSRMVSIQHFSNRRQR